MKTKSTITVAGNGNLQVHIPMIIRRMRGRKQVIAPQALDGEIPEAAETGPGRRHPGAGAGLFLVGNPRDRPGQVDQQSGPCT